MIRVDKTTGAVAIAASLSARDCITLRQVTLHFSSAPTTSENLVFKITNATDGAAYDTVIYTADPSTLSMTDLLWIPGNETVLVSGDSFDISYTNTDTRTYGLKIYYDVRSR